MKATELMLGDWVECQGEYYRIATLKNSGVIELQHSDGSLVSLTTSYIEDVIKPIPLTAGILKLNGYKKKERGMEWRCGSKHVSVIPADRIFDFSLIFVFGKAVDIEYCGESRSECEIQFQTLSSDLYVHQLQHLLRACGYDDLADNFKVRLDRLIEKRRTIKEKVKETVKELLKGEIQ